MLPTTDAGVLKTVQEYVRRISKTPVVCGGKTPGYIVNRLLIPYQVQAIAMLEQGVASVADIDAAIWRRARTSTAWGPSG